MSVLLDWMRANDVLVIWLAVVSAVVFIVSLASLPWLVARIPVDYFHEDHRPVLPWAERHPLIRWPLLILRNLAGLILFAAGLAMLVLPGQGLLTLLASLVLLNFPGKYRLERWLIRQPAILHSVNWLRKRGNRPPLRL